MQTTLVQLIDWGLAAPFSRHMTRFRGCAPYAHDDILARGAKHDETQEKHEATKPEVIEIVEINIEPREKADTENEMKGTSVENIRASGSDVESETRDATGSDAMKAVPQGAIKPKVKADTVYQAIVADELIAAKTEGITKAGAATTSPSRKKRKCWYPSHDNQDIGHSLAWVLQRHC